MMVRQIRKRNLLAVCWALALLATGSLIHDPWALAEAKEPAAEAITKTTNASESPIVSNSPADLMKETVADSPIPWAIWHFEEPKGPPWRDASDHHWQAEPVANLPGTIRSEDGIAGRCLAFRGEHRVQIPNDGAWFQLRQISFSAWVLPTELSSYREIFRKEDGDRRVLFSFQNDGRILSLGLNVNGYIECDAPIRPEDVLDGQWHHCAATFDGRWMRVYLDGCKIGELERPGQMVAGGPALPCIGSLNGGENFQGLLDELIIFDSALTEAQIAAIYRRGLDALVARQSELDSRVKQIYRREASFTQTAAQIRQRFIQLGGDVPVALPGLLAQLVRSDFPRECAALTEYTGWSLTDYLSGRKPGQVRETAQHLCELLLEYRPLTDAQWRRTTPEERGLWRQREALADHVQRLVAAQTPEEDPAWLEAILSIGPQIVFRPRVYEPVAPYIRPSTPATRDWTAAEARAILERDWLFQADGHPTAARIRDEIQWTEELMARLEVDPRAGDFSAEREDLRELEQQIPAEGEHANLYFRVREIKRKIMFRNPAIDFTQVLFIDQPFPQGSEWQHETRHRLGYMAVPGGRLIVLEGLGPEGHLRQLAPQPPLHGAFWRPDLSYDARHVLFCFKPHNEKSFHLYEVAIDGQNLQQLTEGPYDDLDPIYLPDEEHILFVTTRGHTYVRCMPPTNAFILARCDRDGKNIYLISANNEPDYLPSVMPDGRIIYTRWEYTDKPLWRAQGLWTVRPDGTQVQVFWGNQSVWPDLLKDARVIPGTRRVLFTGSAHHNWFSGCLGIIDPDRGFNYPLGLTKVTQELPWPESGPGPQDVGESPRYHVSGRYDAYYSPYPLSERDFLVSAQRDGKFVLYLMDVDGNRELIYEGVHNIWYAQPVRPRPRPPVLPDYVTWPSREDRERPAPGVIYSGDVYQNAPPVLRGRAKYLRIWTIDHKTYTYWYQRPYISTGPVVSAVQSDGVKRLMGTVPIEADGSVAFVAPSGIPLHFQLLDERQRALQTMRSFVNVMPGEQRGCLGCHESHSRTPIGGYEALALQQPPRTIAAPPWDDVTVSYPRYVQPVLDHYCGSCHMGNGEAVKVLDLTPRPGFLGFAEPYFHLTGWPTWGRPYVKPDPVPPGFGVAAMLMVEGYSTTDPTGYKTPPPMTALSYKSPLVELCESGNHYGVKVDEISLLRLITWIDAMCPYRGEEEIREIPDPEFQGVDWLAIRPRIKTAPRIVRPGPMD